MATVTRWCSTSTPACSACCSIRSGGHVTRPMRSAATPSPSASLRSSSCAAARRLRPMRPRALVLALLACLACVRLPVEGPRPLDDHNLVYEGIRLRTNRCPDDDREGCCQGRKRTLDRGPGRRERGAGRLRRGCGDAGLPGAARTGNPCPGLRAAGRERRRCQCRGGRVRSPGGAAESRLLGLGVPGRSAPPGRPPARRGPPAGRQSSTCSASVKGARASCSGCARGNGSH